MTSVARTRMGEVALVCHLVAHKLGEGDRWDVTRVLRCATRRSGNGKTLGFEQARNPWFLPSRLGRTQRS